MNYFNGFIIYLAVFCLFSVCPQKRYLPPSQNSGAMDQNASPIATEPAEKALSTTQKKGVNKFLRQFRRFGWMKKLQTPKPEPKSQLVNSASHDAIAIVNPNARCEFDDTSVGNANTTAPSSPCYDGTFNYLLIVHVTM